MEPNWNISVFLADLKHVGLNQFTKATALHFFTTMLISKESGSGPHPHSRDCPLARCLKDAIFHNAMQTFL